MTWKLPETGRSYSEILAELEGFGAEDPDYREGKTWSLVYYLNREYTEFLSKAYAEYFSANGLNPSAFKSLKRMERDVVGITADLFHGNEEVCGVMTSGGTESCLLAVKTYRDWGRSEKHIRKPEMIIPETAHVAWDKGAEYFGVKIKRARLGKDLRVEPDHVEKLITGRTVMILGSAPEYPHGQIDPIRRLGNIAMKHGIPLHVDACVGGYILPFLEMNGKDIPYWDFRVPGVTSISADIHKYGFAAKGASVILYRQMKHFKHQVFVQQDWPGGVFASPALLGTRPGGAYAAAWAALQANGLNGYRQLASMAEEAAAVLIDGINAIDGLEVMGNPLATLIAYRSCNPAVNIFSVGDLMEERGWHIDRLQRPDALHAMVTPGHLSVTEDYLGDLSECVRIAEAHPELADTGQAATYGRISHVPLRGMVKKQILDMFSSTYAVSGGEINLEDSSSLSGAADGESGGKSSMVQRLVGSYVKRMQRKEQLQK